MAEALQEVDVAYVLRPSFDLAEMTANWPCSYQLFDQVSGIVASVAEQAQAGDAILVMSNRGFDNIHPRLISAIDERL